MATGVITWVTYLTAVALMFAGCFRIHRKLRSKSSLLLLLTLPLYIFIHNLALAALMYFMNHPVPSWVNAWVMWGVSEYMPLFVMLLVSIAIFKISSAQWPTKLVDRR